MVGGRTGTNERSFAVPHQKFIRRAEVGVAVLQSRWRTGRGMVPPVNAYRAGANMAATSVVVDDDTDHEDATTTNSAHVPLNFFFLFYFLFFSFFFLIFFLFSSVNVANVYKRENTWTDRAKRNHFLLHSIRFTRNRNVTVSTDYEGCGDIRGPQPGPKLKYKVSDSRLVRMFVFQDGS